MLIKNRTNDLIMLHCAANRQLHRKKIISTRDTKKMKNAAKQHTRPLLKEKSTIISKAPKIRKIWLLSGKKYETRKGGLATGKLDQNIFKAP